jgi:hypothetical protein
MSFLNLLQSVGDRLGILEAPAKPEAGAPAKIVMRTVTFAELKSEIRSEEVRTLADLPAELTIPFEKVFEAAGVQAAAQGWNVARLKSLLATDAFRGKEKSVAQQALLNLLSIERVPPENLIREAVAQDQALDAFEAAVCRKVADHMGAAEHQIAELENKIKALETEREKLAAKVQLDREKLREWRQGKRAYERELASAIAYLTDHAVISTDTLAE